MIGTDDWLLMLLEGAQVAVALADERVDLGEVVERLSEALGPLLERRGKLDLLVLDLLLEEGGHDDGACACLLELGDRLGIAGQRVGRDDDR